MIRDNLLLGFVIVIVFAAAPLAVWLWHRATKKQRADDDRSGR